MSILSCAATLQNGQLQFWALARLMNGDTQLRSLSQNANGDWYGSPNYAWDTTSWAGAPTNLRKLVASQRGSGLGGQLWALDHQGNLWSTAQNSPGSAWRAWSGPGWNSAPVEFLDISACQFPDGTCLVAGIGTDHQLYRTKQSGAGSPWSAWSTFRITGASSPNNIKKFTMCGVAGGAGIRLFSLDQDEQLWSAIEVADTDAFAGWAGPSVSNAPRKFHELAACVQGRTRTYQLFAIDEQHQLWATSVDAGGNWAPWQGPNWNDASDGCLAVAAAQASGESSAQVWIATADQGLSSAQQISTTGAWGDWDGPNWKLYMIPIPVPRWWSNSLRFYGGHLEAPGAPNIQTGSPYTIEGWVLMDTLSGQQCIIGRWQDSGASGSGGYKLFVDNGTLVFMCNPSYPPLRASQAMTAGVWHHVAVCMTGVAATLYLDGASVGSSETPTFPWDDSVATWIGACQLLSGSVVTAYQPFQGLMGRLRIWNSAHDQLNILLDSMLWDVNGPAKNLLLVYFDFTALPPAEISGADIKLILVGQVTSCLNVPSVALTGNGYVDAGNNPGLSLDGTAPYTIDGWFRSDNPNGTLIGRYRSGLVSQYQVYLFNQLLNVLRTSLDAQVNSAPFQFQTGVWQHFGVTFDGSQIRLYLNGNLAATNPWAAQLNVPGVPTLLGAATGGSVPQGTFQGNIQGIRIWPRCLETSELQQWMFWDTAEEELKADFDFSTQPPMDATTQNALTLVNGAAGVITRQDVDASWTVQPRRPRPEKPVQSRDVQPAAEVIPTPAAWGSPIPEIFTAADRATSLASFARMVPVGTPGRDQLLARFTAAYDGAAARYKSDPSAAQDISARQEGADLVLTHHTPRGDVEILRTAAIDWTPCNLWWAVLFYKCSVGFFGALGFPIAPTSIAKRLYIMLTGNQTIQDTLQSLVTLGKSGDLPGLILLVIKLIELIYQTGYLWPLVKMAITASTWAAVVWILKTLLKFLSLEAEVVELLVDFGSWGAGLILHCRAHDAACGSSPTA